MKRLTCKLSILSLIFVIFFLSNHIFAYNGVENKTKNIENQKQANDWFNKGEALLAKKEYDKAFQAYKNALNLNPKHMAALFRSGMLMMNYYHNDSQALRYFIYGIKLDPQYPAFHYNAGQILQNLKQYKASLARYLDAAKLLPEDWAIRAKLIQLYDVLADYKNRDVQREIIYTLYKSGKVKSIQFCRDQFFVDDFRKVVCYENFELKGEFAVKYTFYLLDSKSNNLRFRFILGSYNALNIISRKQGKLKANQRLFHLDGYTIDGRSHWTFGFYNHEPSYDQVKKIVIAILHRKIKPISGSTPSSRAAEKSEKP